MKETSKYKGKYPVPGKGAQTGCLGRDGTYSKKNCKDDDYWTQGIGKV